MARADANYKEAEKQAAREIGSPSGNKLAPPEIKLRSQCGAAARGIGCPRSDVAWAGQVGLRQRPRVPAGGAEERGSAAPRSALEPALRQPGRSLSSPRVSPASQSLWHRIPAGV